MIKMKKWKPKTSNYKNKYNIQLGKIEQLPDNQV